MTECSRTWEASALEDGRLDAQSVASFERHVRTCSICTREVTELRRLRELMLLAEHRAWSPLEHRRLRQQLLRVANEHAVRPARAAGLRSMLLLVGVLGVAPITVVAFRHASVRATISTSRGVPAPHYELDPGIEAAFHVSTLGPVRRIALREGSLKIHVEHLLPQQRFLVDLPDGELEVRGTRFVVEASEGHTKHVHVFEGLVALRLNGESERLIASGQDWVEQATTSPGDHGSGRGAPVAKARAIPAPSNVAPRSTPGARGVSPMARRVEHSLSSSSSAPGAKSGEDHDVGPAPGANAESIGSRDASAAFVAGMNAFSTGAYREADERFAEFAARFGGDPHSEDADYLRVVIALRRGDHSTAVVRARDYMTLFPHGLRRTELERLLGDANPTGVSDASP